MGPIEEIAFLRAKLRGIKSRRKKQRLSAEQERNLRVQVEKALERIREIESPQIPRKRRK